MYQISFYVPTEHVQVVKNVLFDAGDNSNTPLP
jgi:hypothetical protein